MFKVEMFKRSPAGARVMKIHYQDKIILTMQRVLTSTELNYNSALRAAKIPVPEYKESDFFEYRKFYKIEQLRKLYLGDGKLFQTHKKELRPYVLKNQSKIKIFRPIIDFGEVVTWKDVLALIDLAQHTGFDIIAIPDSFYFNVEKFTSIILKAKEYASETAKMKFGDIEIMPSINVLNRINYFREKLMVTKKSKFNFVCIENGYYLTSYPHYYFLREFSGSAKNLCIYGSNAPRLHRRNWKTSGVHLYTAFGQDLISQGIPKPFISREGKESVHDNPKSWIKLFDPKQDALIKRGEYNEKYGETLIFDSPYCHGETLTSFMNKYNNQMLGKIAKIVEFGESSKTLLKERDAVLIGNYRATMEKKGVIGQLIRSLNQKVLV